MLLLLLTIPGSCKTIHFPLSNCPQSETIRRLPGWCGVKDKEVYLPKIKPATCYPMLGLASSKGKVAKTNVRSSRSVNPTIVIERAYVTICHLKVKIQLMDRDTSAGLANFSCTTQCLT